MNYSNVIKDEIKKFYPGYFALVMATGIVSMACLQFKLDVPGKILFMLNNVQYFILAAIFIIRLIFFFKECKEDLSTNPKGAGFLTIVAASSIIGTGYAQGRQMFDVAVVFLMVALICWLILIYSFLSLIILQKEKPSLEHGINGSWLLLIVSTQSTIILASSVLSHLSIPVEVALFTVISGWLTGILLYVILVTLIVYRLIFCPINASEISPSYWIDAGAAAITTLAGVTLSNAITNAGIYQQYLPIVNLVSLLFWAVATFWIPLLFILETWRHYKAGFKYSPEYWSLVFPLAMYSVATVKLAPVVQMPFLHSIAHVFLLIALFVWLVTFVAMIKSLFDTFQNKSVD